MTSQMLKEEQIRRALASAVEAGNAAALKVWNRDGREDRGSCGGAMLEFDTRTLVARKAEAMGITYRSGRELWLRLSLPDGVRSQNADIPDAQFKAFRETLEAAGYGNAIKRFWNYTD